MRYGWYRTVGLKNKGDARSRSKCMCSHARFRPVFYVTVVAHDDNNTLYQPYNFPLISAVYHELGWQ